MKYRPEIDGLRALAVVPVVLFHAGFGMVGGGYVGVDVFFVISGYLITTIIIKALDEGSFSLATFYERRARRILPALFVVLLTCIPLAWLWLSPKDMKAFAESLIAVVTFSSNFHFRSQSGYFAAAAELQPLLHTWSLAVEEQYYIVFPLFLMAAWKLGRRNLAIVLGALLLLSLSVAQWAALNEPVFGFFFLQTRGWELILGSLCAFYMEGAKRRAMPRHADLLGLAGIAFILIAILAFDDETPTPGLLTLLPTVGAALVILFAHGRSLAGRLLASAPLVGIGLISYSAYLWHQPVLAFARHAATGELPAAARLALAVLAFALGWLTWRFVEGRFRDGALFGRRTIWLGSATAACAIALFGHLGDRTSGFETAMMDYKYGEAERVYARTIARSTNYAMDETMVDDGHCAMWVRNDRELDMARVAACRQAHGGAIVVLGDSHAMNIYNVLAKSRPAPFVIGIAQGGCRPHDGSEHCQYADFDGFLASNPGLVRTLVFHQAGSHFIEDQRGDVDKQQAFEGKFGGFRRASIDRVIDWLNAIDPKFDGKLIWLGPFAEYRFDPQDAIWDDSKRVINANSRRIFEALDGEIVAALAGPGFSDYVPFSRIFRLPDYLIENDCFIFYDADHLSRCGEDVLARNFDEKNLEQLTLTIAN